MQLDSLVDRYRDLLLEALQQHFGLTRDKADIVLKDFLIQKSNSQALADSLSKPDSIPGDLLVAVRNHAFDYFQTNRTLASGETYQDAPESQQKSPRFSAMGASDAETVWALSLIGPAVSIATHSAPNAIYWRLFVESRLKPLITAQQRPALRQLIGELALSSEDEANIALNAEQERWHRCIHDQLRQSVPSDVSPEQVEDWFAERVALLAEVVQRMIGAGFNESVEQIRCVQQLIDKCADEDHSDATSHLRSGLRTWDSFLQERIEKWDNPRYIYDVGAVFIRRPVPAHVSTGPAVSQSGAQSEPMTESIDEIVAELNRILAMPLPCENDLFMSSYLADPSTRHNKGLTITELLTDRYPPEQGLRLLKDIAKQQGPDANQPWHLAVSKLIYFAAIAAFLVRVNSNPAEVTSLSFHDLSKAFHWAEDLPGLTTSLKRLFTEAWQTIDMRLT